MSLSLTKYPVYSVGAVYTNVFAGFDAVNLEFKREDSALVQLSQGADNFVELSIPGDITDSLNVGESVYFYSEGLNFTYDQSAKVTEISYNGVNTVILTDADYIEAGAGGYLNYKQNYAVEVKLIDVNNPNILKYPAILTDSGTASGLIKISVNPVVDFLQNEFETTSKELTNGRVKFTLRYREIWREAQNNSFVSPRTGEADEPLIIRYGAENKPVEKFLNEFDEPKIWDGYNFAINFIHSDLNNEGDAISIQFDELDINKATITSLNALHQFAPGKYGILQTNIADKSISYNQYTRYIKFTAIDVTLPQYDPAEYASPDYST